MFYYEFTPPCSDIWIEPTDRLGAVYKGVRDLLLQTIGNITFLIGYFKHAIGTKLQ